jgi:hypothetical protein
MSYRDSIITFSPFKYWLYYYNSILSQKRCVCTLLNQTTPVCQERTRHGFNTVSNMDLGSTKLCRP